MYCWFVILAALVSNSFMEYKMLWELWWVERMGGNSCSLFEGIILAGLRSTMITFLRVHAPNRTQQDAFPPELTCLDYGDVIFAHYVLKPIFNFPPRMSCTYWATKHNQKYEAWHSQSGKMSVLVFWVAELSGLLRRYQHFGATSIIHTYSVPYDCKVFFWHSSGNNLQYCALVPPGFMVC